MHVWSGAHEMPLPQLLGAGAMVGMADTLQTSIAIMNNDAFIGYVCCWLCVLLVMCVVGYVCRVLCCFYYLFIIFIRACMNA
jgi:hypothetical protein